MNNIQQLPPRKPNRESHDGGSINQLIPNLLTTIALCGGLVAIRYALDGYFKTACLALLISAALDGLDGRMARLLKATSRFGEEYDSLSDFVCFGVAPSLLIYLWCLQDYGRFAFIPCLFYTICIGLRLARFNATLEQTKPYMQNFFQGVPAPAAAGLALFPIFVNLEVEKVGILVNYLAYAPYLSLASLLGGGFLAISSIPVWSFKRGRIPSNYFLPILLTAGLYTAFLVAEPWAALAVAGVIYILVMPFSAFSCHRAYRAYKRAMNPPRDIKTARPAAHASSKNA